MTVEPLLPDVPPGVAPPVESSDAAAFARALDGLGTLLSQAQSAEDTFAAGGGSLQDAVYERARADVALSVATAVAQHGATAISSILNMQV